MAGMHSHLARAVTVVVLAALASPVFPDGAAGPAQVRPVEHLVAAHYYPWFDAGRWSYSECATGAVRLDLAPAQPPLLGRYDSSSEAVVDQHLRWCAEHGINVLVLEFIRPGSREDRISREVILPHSRSGDVRFSVLYDWAIRFGSFQVTAERIASARADFDHLAREYFTHPSYLKVRGKLPLVMIYVTRALKGDVAGLISGIREACAARGFEPFLVGDEFFFTSSPDAKRISRWDGIFGYDVYAGKGGYWETNGTLDLFRRRTSAYREAAAASGVKFLPSAAPGFNDRAIRRKCEDHPVLPRRARSGGDPASLFRATFVETALPAVDPELPMVVITSFNEWHEDTQIEPTRGGEATTAADTSSSGSAYTQGFEHDDYGLLFLEVIRDATLAVTGRVTGPGGPLAGASIDVLDGEAVVLSRKSFSTGAFTVPRLRLESRRPYRLRASHPGLGSRMTEPIVVLPDRAVTGVEITLSPVR
jgi:hypothetical protein